ncbi:TSC22 domain family protein 1-like isoform X2 [Tachysurus fulvidraco]|uniref:TSC22 domain family protein 1-like isoform X2 n=1 Tax=Tachysurus fulvidraco TaxID=1234273 RepID=UPI001FEE0F98|nr:TSC22 domain family protein 1-like isoform X2 [Tachysurus fulvidraco]
MHHSELTGDSPGTKKVAHASIFTSRRGSNTGNGDMSASLNAVNMNCNAILTDDHESSILIHHAPPAGSSLSTSTCLNLHIQSQSLQSAGAQGKKKSGFQITSVLPAQVSANNNNSIADDTGGYDDMDESHTEDLSSSDIFTVTGIRERSFSEETLNGLHGRETPGDILPNELGNPHLHSVQPGCMLNGTVYHHKDHGLTSIPTPQQPFQGLTMYSSSLNSSALSLGTTVQSVAATQSRTQRLASVQGAVVDVCATVNVNQISISASGSATGSSGAGMPGGVIRSNAIEGGLLGTTGITVTAMQNFTAPGTTQIQSSTAIASRFRLVKLDSSSEPTRKGRWMCTEYYEKEGAAAAPFADAASSYRTVDNCIYPESDGTIEASSCNTLSVLGDHGMQLTQQNCVPPAVSVLHPSLSQKTSQLHTHSQDTGINTLTSPPLASCNNPQFISVPSLLSTESQPSPPMAQQQIPYNVEGLSEKLMGGYPINQFSRLMSQDLQAVDYAQISNSTQAPSQSHQMLTIQSCIRLRATAAPSHPAGTPTIPVPQSVSPKPQVPFPQKVLAKGSTVNQVQQYQPQMPPEQQATANQPPQSVSLNTGQTTPSIFSSSLQSNIQPAIPTYLLHEGLAGDHSGGQSSQILPARDPYGSVAPLITSQLEDASRLLFHQSLFSQYDSEASVSFGQKGSASGDASLGTDEDRSFQLTTYNTQ